MELYDNVSIEECSPCRQDCDITQDFIAVHLMQILTYCSTLQDTVDKVTAEGDALFC